MTHSFHNFEPFRCPCPILTVASWPTYRFLRRQIKVIWCSHLLKNFGVCCDPHSQSRDITLLTEVHTGKAEVFFFPVIMYRCESWTIKKAENWRTDALEWWRWKRLLRMTWTARDQTGQSERKYQPWVFIGRTDAEAEAPKLCPPDVKSQLIGKDPDAGKDWKQEEKGAAEDEMVI